MGFPFLLRQISKTRNYVTSQAVLSVPALWYLLLQLFCHHLRFQSLEQFEVQINRSDTLEGIYNHKDNKCSLLYEENIATVTTDPNILSTNPRERVKMMRDIYENIQLVKTKRIRTLENLTEGEKLRKSKRLMSKPKKSYKK